MLKQQLKLKLSQKLSPQQIQLMKLIQLPTLEFEQRLQQEIEENPALEKGKESEDQLDNFEDDSPNDSETIEAEDINIDEYLSDDEIPDYRLQANNRSQDDEDRNTPYAAGTSFHQHLQSQLDTFTLEAHQEEIAAYLVGSVDDAGYLRRAIEDIVDDLAFTQNLNTTVEEVTQVLKVVQLLDPPGVGARNLQECLLIQLQQKEKTDAVENTIKVLEKGFEAFSKRHFEKLSTRFNLSEQALKEVLKEVEKLNPKPGAAFSGHLKANSQVTPDFTIQIIDGNLELTLNGRNAPELHVSREYTNLLEGYKASKEKEKSQQEAVLFIKQKLDAAKWFIDAIQQRNQTLFATMQAIMNFQQAYFLSGDEHDLKPMILKDIADIVQMDISTISRVANSKYVDTPYGTKLVKSFFSEGMTTDEGVDVSTIEIKKTLETLLENENKKKPLTDQELAKILNNKGYPIARRTVAKYRELIGAPVARLRKQL